MHSTNSAGVIAPRTNNSVPTGKIPNNVEVITVSAKYMNLNAPRHADNGAQDGEGEFPLAFVGKGKDGFDRVLLFQSGSPRMCILEELEHLRRAVLVQCVYFGHFPLRHMHHIVATRQYQFGVVRHHKHRLAQRRQPFDAE